MKQAFFFLALVGIVFGQGLIGDQLDVLETNQGNIQTAQTAAQTSLDAIGTAQTTAQTSLDSIETAQTTAQTSLDSIDNELTTHDSAILAGQAQIITSLNSIHTSQQQFAMDLFGYNWAGASSGPVCEVEIVGVMTGNSAYALTGINFGSAQTSYWQYAQSSGVGTDIYSRKTKMQVHCNPLETNANVVISYSHWAIQWNLATVGLGEFDPQNLFSLITHQVDTSTFSATLTFGLGTIDITGTLTTSQ